MPQISREAKLDELLSAVAALLASAEAKPSGAGPALDLALDEIKTGLTLRPDAAPKRMPACRHVERALQLGQAGPPRVARLAWAFAALEPHLAWTQNPNYTAENLGAHYIDNYAYADIVGPRGLAESPCVAMGFLLLGPGLHYPDHAHEAEEIYLVMAGDNLWRRGEGDWYRKPLGSLIHHPPWTRHAVKAGKEPLFVFYIWYGALDRPAQLLGE